MGTIDDVGQKIKGKVQQVKGDIEMNSGHEGHGMWEKTKGKVNEAIADMKINSNTHND